MALKKQMPMSKLQAKKQKSHLQAFEIVATWKAKLNEVMKSQGEKFLKAIARMNAADRMMREIQLQAALLEEAKHKAAREEAKIQEQLADKRFEASAKLKELKSAEMTRRVGLPAPSASTAALTAPNPFDAFSMPMQISTPNPFTSTTVSLPPAPSSKASHAKPVAKPKSKAKPKPLKGILKKPKAKLEALEADSDDEKAESAIADLACRMEEANISDAEDC